MAKSSWGLLVVCLMAVTQLGESIKCYSCGTNEYDCADNPDLDKIAQIEDQAYCWKSKTIQPSNMAMVSRGGEAGDAVAGDVNDVEGCLWCDHPTDCNARKIECACFTDLCNSANVAIPSCLALAAIAAILHFLY